MGGKAFQNVKKLGDDNVYMWREEVMCGMVIERLSRWLTTEPAADNADETEAAARCRAYLYMALEPKWQRDVTERGGMTACMMWAYLNEAATRLLEPQEMAYATKLSTMSQGDDQTISQYLEEAEKLSICLQSINRPVDVRTLIMRIVQGLSKDYDAVRDNLILNANIYDSVAKLRAALLALEVAKADQTPKKNHVSFVARPQRWNNRGRSDERPTSSGYRAGDFRGNITCHYCGNPGHKNFECQLRARDKYGEQPTTFAEGYPRKGVIPSSPTSLMSCSTHGSSQRLESKNAWVVDSGATSHMAVDRDAFMNFRPVDKPSKVLVGNGHFVDVMGTGDVLLHGEFGAVMATDVLWVPDLVGNLFSLTTALARGATCSASGETVMIRDAKGALLLSGTVYNDLIWLNLCTGSTALPAVNHAAFNVRVPAQVRALELHRRFGHMGFSTLADMVSLGLINTTVTSSDLKQAGHAHVCEPCIAGKTHRVSHPGKHHSASLCTLHSDILGPVQAGAADKYMVSCIVTHEDVQYGFADLVASKDRATEFVKETELLVTRQYGVPVQRIRTDRGREYMSNDFDAWCKSKGIILETTAGYTPEQNGVAERFNRTIIEKVRVLLFDSGLGTHMWGECMKYALQVWNLSPKTGTTVSRHEKFFKTIPNLDVLQPFGAVAWVHVPKEKRTKLQDKAVKGTLVGYEPPFGSRAYRILLDSGKVVVSCDVVFPSASVSSPVRGTDVGEGAAVLDTSSDDEMGGDVRDTGHLIASNASPTLPIQSRVEEVPPVDDTLRITPLPTIAEGDEEEAEDTAPETDVTTHEEPNADSLMSGEPVMQSDPANRARLTRSCRQGSAAMSGIRTEDFLNRQAPVAHRMDRMSDFRSATRTGSGIMLGATSPVHGFGPDPQSVEEALSRPDAAMWKEAIDSEIDSLVAHGSWRLEDLPEDRRPVGSKFVLTRKRDGRYKARLVAQGFTQMPGVDYSDTYAPVSRYATFRALMSHVAAHDLEMSQLDIKTAFLNGQLEEEVYMKLPPGFEHLGPPGTVCRLLKALYGLKQSPRAWNKMLVEYLLGEGFQQSTADASLFFKDTEHGRVFVLVYVDDCLVAAPRKQEVQAVVNHISKRFEAHSLGEPSDFCGIIIERNREQGTIKLHQEPYIRQLLKACDMDGTDPKTTPQPSAPLVTDGEALTGAQLTAYPSIVGSVMHLANCTRPDIAQPVSRLSRFLKKPTTLHWAAAIHLLKYLAGTADVGLKYGPQDGLQGFCDSDFAGDADNRRSTSGFVYKMNGAAITWQSRLQSTVSQSTMEAEYQAAGLAGRDGLWLRQLLTALMQKPPCSISILCDNEAALCLIKNPMNTARSKHIDVVHHFIRERVATGELVYSYVESGANAADCLTKFVPADKLRFCCAQMGLH